MRIFLAGASGVIGVRLLPLLVAEGHIVAAMTRSPEKSERLRELGGEPIVCDVYDSSRLTRVVREFRPEVVYHQLTDLPDDVSELGEYHPRQDRIWTEGTHNLLVAAEGADRVIAQSIAWEPPEEHRREALMQHERAVLERDGVIVRYGQLYGPQTFYDGQPPPAPPRVHVDDAARLSLQALQVEPRTILIIDDDGVREERATAQRFA